MTTSTEHLFKIGNDPRALPDYIALRDELAKLTHPARPDVNWRYVSTLCLSLFEQNGLELQTVSWYTLARLHQQSIAGLNEGLSLLVTLITQQWGAMWPQQAHARMEILCGLNRRLQSVLRMQEPHYADLPQVYQAEQYLSTLCEFLTRLELKNASQITELYDFLHNMAIKLENRDSEEDVVLPASFNRTIPPAPVVVIAQPPVETAPKPQTAPPVVQPQPRFSWRAFTAGMLTMLVLGAGGIWGWQKIYPAPVSPIPLTASADSLKTLAQLPPLWRQEYGLTLAARARPEEAEKLKAQWQQSISTNALPVTALSAWHQGMEGLQELTRRLNTLDERKGKYLTASELKSMVFTITQDFSRTTPMEEHLYQLSLLQNDAPPPSAQLVQMDSYFEQLLNRYMLLKEHNKLPTPQQ